MEEQRLKAKVYSMTTIQNPIEITVYVVGETKDDALSAEPWEHEAQAVEYAFSDHPWPVSVYEVTAYIDPSTITDSIRSFPEVGDDT